MNKVILVGNLTRDPEPSTTESGINYCRFTVAIKRPRSKDNTDFVGCIAWRKTADLICNYVQKGSKLGVSGYIQTGSYEKNGQRVYTTDVVVDEIEFLSTKNSSQGQGGMPYPEPPAPATKITDMQSIEDDDLPF